MYSFVFAGVFSWWLLLSFVLLSCTSSAQTLAAKRMKKLFLIQSDEVDAPMIRQRIDIGESFDNSAFITEIQSALHTQEAIHLEIFDENENKFIPMEVSNPTVLSLLQETRPSHLLAHIIHQNEPSSSSTLMIKCRQFDVSNGLLLENGGKVLVTEPGQASLGTGLTSWDGSVVLAKYFEYHPELIRNKRILEVGAGTGIAGMAASLLGAQHVLLTDLPYTIDNLAHNVNRTRQANPTMDMTIAVEHVDWKDETTYPVQNRAPWDVLIGADVVWLQGLVPPLVHTLHACTVSADTVIYLAHQTRSKHLDDYLFEQLKKYFRYEIVDRKEYHPQYNSSLVYIIKIYR